jgi:hypothetical protein
MNDVKSPNINYIVLDTCILTVLHYKGYYYTNTEIYGKLLYMTFQL